MTKKQFTEWMLKAEAFQGIAQLPEDEKFWAGYRSGLYQCFRGEPLPGGGEEALIEITGDDQDLVRRAEDEGYRAGLNGMDPVSLYKAGHEFLTGPQLAEATGVGKSRIRQLAKIIPGGRKTKYGWRFPLSAVAVVNSRAKPGDHSRGVKRNKKGETPDGP